MFDIEEIQQCLVTQSVYFLELFTQQFMVRFEPFLYDLEETKCFSAFSQLPERPPVRRAGTEKDLPFQVSLRMDA